MGRILAIDYGEKRTGIAVTDPLKIIATPLETIETKELKTFLKDYFEKETVDSVVIGEPLGLKGGKTHNTDKAESFYQYFKSEYPSIPISKIDERFTSKIAQQSMIMANKNKKFRSTKGNLDKTSAVIILQDFLQQQEL